MISDIKESIEIVRSIHGWIKNIIDEHQSMQEQHDAQLLGSTVSLIYSFRALDNGINTVLGKLIILDEGWSKKERLALLYEITEFAHSEEIITLIRDSLRDINHLLFKTNDKGERITHKEDFDQFDKIFQYGAEIVRQMSGSPVTPFPDRDALRDFSDRVKGAENNEDINNIIETSTRIMDMRQRTYRESELSEELSRLKHQIMERHNWTEKELGW